MKEFVKQEEFFLSVLQYATNYSQVCCSSVDAATKLRIGRPLPAREERFSVCDHIQSSSGATSSYFCLMTLPVPDTNLSSRTALQCYIGYWFSVVCRHICLFTASSSVRFFCFITFSSSLSPRHFLFPSSFFFDEHLNICLIFFSRKHIYVFCRINGIL